MANWFNETMLPLFSAGDISEIYIGERSEAVPTAIPPTNLNEMKEIIVVDKAEPKVEKRNKKAEIKRVFLLPKWSAGLPEMATPNMQPIRRLPTAHPSSISFRLKYFLIKGIVPDITAVSNPKSKPPIATTMQTKKRYLLFIFIKLKFCTKLIKNFCQSLNS